MAFVTSVRMAEFRNRDEPEAAPGSRARLWKFVAAHRRILVLTGAGCSTGSGIPAYRDGDGQWTRRRPILYQEFLGSAKMQRRYWARSYFGWPVMQAARPNGAHRALVALERAARLSAVVTQNVDGLHRQAGQASLVELHGSLAEVVCLACGERSGRAAVQCRLKALNPGWHPGVAGFNPDGDAELDEAAYPGFEVAGCATCGGVLKPDVVFFGESVPATRVEAVRAALAASDAVLVAGTSLAVFSGYRIVREAAAMGLPVAAVNNGRTRADGLLAFKVAGDCGQVLSAAVRGLSAAADACGPTPA